MSEFLEILHQMLTDGITWATAITIILAWHKWRESKRKKVAYERMERKIDVLMEKEGVIWSGQLNESEKAHRSLSKSFRLCLAAPLRIYERSVKQVKISKAWLSGVIAYLFGQLAIKWGFTFNDQMADTAADFVITLIIPLFIAFVNRNKKEGTNEFTIHTGNNK